MKAKTNNDTQRISKYDISIMLLVVFTVIFILGVWIWFGHKSSQIEKELTNVKSSLIY